MNGTTALACVAEPTIVAPLATFAGIETALAQLRQAVKDVVSDLPMGKVEGHLIDMMRSLDTAKVWLDFAVRQTARDTDRS